MLRGEPYREEYNRPDLKKYCEWRDNQKPDEDGYTYTICTKEIELEILAERRRRRIANGK